MKIIKNIESVKLILDEVGIKPMGSNECMSDLLYENILLHVPNFLINDPFHKKELIEDKSIKEEKIDVNLS